MCRLTSEKNLVGSCGVALDDVPPAPPVHGVEADSGRRPARCGSERRGPRHARKPRGRRSCL
eukprot:2090541-Alexandrium_andersonii.AAC.1